MNWESDLTVHGPLEKTYSGSCYLVPYHLVDILKPSLILLLQNNAAVIALHEQDN